MPTVTRSSKTGRFVDKRTAKKRPASTQTEKVSVSEKKILKEFDKYVTQLFANGKVSDRKFQAMQAAITGCRYIINDLFGSPRKKVYAKTK